MIRESRPGERGQALLLVVLALAIFLLLGLGLAIDAGMLYVHRQVAQAAADAAAESAIMSVFNRTNTGTNAFGDTAFQCTPVTDERTPCEYARLNGVDRDANDRVDVDFPLTVPGAPLSSADDPAAVHVVVTRNVPTSFMRLAGIASSSVRAEATAAIVSTMEPVPIIVLHPSLRHSFKSNGNPTITICGGPLKSIQINSSNLESIDRSMTNTTVDLSHAGPNDPGNCTTGTGGDFGDYGGPGAPTFRYVSGLGQYIQPASPIHDPLAGVPEPAPPATAGKKTSYAVCPYQAGVACDVYEPGYFAAGIKVKNAIAYFNAGLYYCDKNGFIGDANSDMRMVPGAAVHPSYTEIGTGMVVFNAGKLQSDVFDVGANGNVSLVGAPIDSIYKGILFFEKRDSAAHNDTTHPPSQHRIGGGGSVTLIGTIYLTNGEDRLTGSYYQQLLLQGTPGSSTKIVGEIIADTLLLGGNAGITMSLRPDSNLLVRQVALIR